MAVDSVARSLAISAISSGGGEPDAYLKSASVSGKVLTLTNKDDSTVTFTDTGSIVTGTNDGTNWTSLTIDGTTKNIPSGGGSSYTAGDGISISNNEISVDNTVWKDKTGSSPQFTWTGNKTSDYAIDINFTGGYRIHGKTSIYVKIENSTAVLVDGVYPVSNDKVQIKTGGVDYLQDYTDHFAVWVPDGNNLTITKVIFGNAPATIKPVSGTTSGDYWSSLMVDGLTKSIPTISGDCDGSNWTSITINGKQRDILSYSAGDGIDIEEGSISVSSEVWREEPTRGGELELTGEWSSDDIIDIDYPEGYAGFAGYGEPIRVYITNNGDVLVDGYYDVNIVNEIIINESGIDYIVDENSEWELEPHIAIHLNEQVSFTYIVIDGWKTVGPVSGTNDGTNWTSITIKDETYNIPSIPTKTSELINDSGFLTEHQSLANYSTTSEMNSAISAHHDSSKQNTLTAGTNITIENNVISATGGGGGEPASYLKSASVSGNTLTLTNKDNTTVAYAPKEVLYLPWAFTEAFSTADKAVLEEAYANMDKYVFIMDVSFNEGSPQFVPVVANKVPSVNWMGFSFALPNQRAFYYKHLTFDAQGNLVSTKYGQNSIGIQQTLHGGPCIDIHDVDLVPTISLGTGTNYNFDMAFGVGVGEDPPETSGNYITIEDHELDNNTYGIPFYGFPKTECYVKIEWQSLDEEDSIILEADVVADSDGKLTFTQDGKTYIIERIDSGRTRLTIQNTTNWQLHYLEIAREENDLPGLGLPYLPKPQNQDEEYTLVYKPSIGLYWDTRY